MDWEKDEDEFPLGPQPVGLPKLMDSVSIDQEIESIKGPEEEISHDGGIANPVIVLAEQFPHIAARIAHFWGSRRKIDEYLSQIVMLDRTSRQGFPKHVMAALMEIWNIHRTSFERNGDPSKPWANDPHLDKSFKKVEQEFSLAHRAELTGAEAAALDRTLTERAQFEAAQAELAKTGRPLSGADLPIDL